MPDDRELTSERFGEFYRELHPERTPYKWHERAAMELAQGTAWHEGAIWGALSAPTGAGKTTLIECFLFSLACSMGHDMVPRRLFWVVDRRNVIDQVFTHAQAVADKIAEANPGGLVELVKNRLDRLADGTTQDGPIQVRLWRGGLSGEATLDLQGYTTENDSHGGPGGKKNTRALLRSERLGAPLSPCACAIVCSTVDQLGSRLLFRGYGVSRRSRPIEAALTGMDSLIVLDEAHLSGAFEATASAIANVQRDKLAHPAVDQKQRDRSTLVRPMQVLPVTATRAARHDDRRTFELNPAEQADPALLKRLTAERPATLLPTRNPVLTCATAAHECANEGAMVIGVVANRVANARTIANALRNHGEVLLIIGPSRPLDRVHLLDKIPDREARRGDEPPMFVVGTQTLEVGLDLDFDALVTECAPLQSLIQRFGRLDRAGDLAQAGRPGRGVIVQPPKVSGAATTATYAAAATATWEFLNGEAERAELDFSAEKAARMLATAPAEARELKQPTPPLLQPWHIELLSQTSHTPKPDPDVAVFLRGEKALEPTDVHICWRADLTEQNLSSWRSRVEARLPHPAELLPLPLHTARRWLAGRDPGDDLTDIEGIGAETLSMERTRPETGTEITSNADSVIIRVPPPDYDGIVKPQEISPSQVRPGDVIVLRAKRGGCDAFGWDPSSHEPVSDLGNLSQSWPRLLLSDSVGAPGDLLPEATEVVHLIESENLSEEEGYEQLRSAAASWLQSGGGFQEGTPAYRAAKARARLPQRGRAMRFHEGSETTFPADVILVPHQERRKKPRVAVPYDQHIEAVSERVDRFTKSLGLSPDLSKTLRIAAEHHDLGKLDRRFQAWLNGGIDPEKALAKSARGDGAPRSWVAQRWPSGKRHELTSVALLDRVPKWPDDVDRDLLLYLVSTHHGDGRPFRSYVPDTEPVTVSAKINGEEISVLSSEEIPWPEHARRFVALNEHFGPWGLAAIETLLVLADRSVSAEGS
jgi:CRISPR-associated endonuclease/helicase Cas3